MKLSNARYESIKKDVVKVLSKYNINTIPIDPFQLAKRMGISLIKYSEMDEKYFIMINVCQIRLDLQFFMRLGIWLETTINLVICLRRKQIGLLHI